ncbi:MAG: aspartyl protease [Planctomycetaceae bacterium]|nr:aspartyl protease [Planctomycetaceae bacterium]
MSTAGVEEMGRVTVDFVVTNLEDVIRANSGEIPREKVRSKRLRGVINTGAMRLVLPETVAIELGLPMAGQTKVRYADQCTATRKMVEFVRLELLGRHGHFAAILEPDRKDALIGAIVLEDLDLIVDCGTQSLRPRDPDVVVSEIE